jgi:OmpA-OmpF porin, OOP family
MKTLGLAFTFTLAAAAALPAAAQTTSTSTGTGINWPHQSGFWGHVGASTGVSRFDGSCFGGTACDRRDQALRLFAGGRFNNTIGGEVAWLNLGEFTRGGGETDSQALDLVATAGFPLGANSSVFGKLGAVYYRSEVTGTAAGLRTGKEDGWGPRFGLGAQVGLSRNWALRADWDRYRIKLPGEREQVDTFLVGAQYSFR